MAAYKQPRSQVLLDLPVSLRSDGVGENSLETRLAYKWLKTMENYETIRSESDLGHLWEVVVYEMGSNMVARLYFFVAISPYRAVGLIIFSSS